MQRRDFLKSSAMSGLALGLGVSSAHAAAPPSFQYWMHGFGGDDPAATANALAEAGFDVVVQGGDKIIEAVRAAGMRSWLCGGAFGIGQDQENLKAVNLQEERVIWFGSGCPNNPEIREKNLESYRAMAATEGVEGILVDGCRFASPASGLKGFFTCFCPTCEEKAKKLDIDFARMKVDVQTLYDAITHIADNAQGTFPWLQSPIGIVEWLSQHPGLYDWLRFRRMSVMEHFRDIEKLIHGGGKKMGVYIFMPSIAPVVGQSYRDLSEFIDVFSPMIYRNYPTRPGEACLNWELTGIVEELGLQRERGEQVMGLLLGLCDLDGVVSERNWLSLQQELPPEAVAQECMKARSLVGPDKTLVPIIHIDDPEMKKTVGLCKDAKPDGLNFFVYGDKWKEQLKSVIPLK